MNNFIIATVSSAAMQHMLVVFPLEEPGQEREGTKVIWERNGERKEEPGQEREGTKVIWERNGERKEEPGQEREGTKVIWERNGERKEEPGGCWIWRLGEAQTALEGLICLRANWPVSRLTLPFHIGSNTDAKSNVLIGQEAAPKPPTPHVQATGLSGCIRILYLCDVALARGVDSCIGNHVTKCRSVRIVAD
uniref:Uncharacterized protein n=1 Tax=Timema monikensis TaxID=170555 RepID=A0A7R9E4E1_9NEOP|nr:unnamed protein product [Timema monikensis]